jgi:hypothetical protein
MDSTDHFKEVSKDRLIRLVAGGACAGIILDTALFLQEIPEKMRCVLLWIIIILLPAILNRLDFILRFSAATGSRYSIQFLL